MTAAKNKYSKAFLDDIKSVLLEEKSRLTGELSKFTHKNPNVEGDFEAEYPEYGDKGDENALEVQEYTVNKPLEITLEKALRDVNESIKRLESGSYGTCKYCDNPIDEERLKARPTSSSCVSCKKTLTDEA